MTAPRNWQEMTHDELYAAVQRGPGAGASMAAEAMWRRLAEILVEAESRMHAATARSGDGWQGAGGDAARSGLGSLNGWALEAATDARITLSTILDQAVSAGRLRASMPAPPTREVAAARAEQDLHPGDANVQWAAVDAEQRALAADEDARRKMEQYHWLSNENRRTIDFWTVPPTVLVETASTAPAGAGSGLGGPGAGAPVGVGAAGVVAPGPAGGAVGGPDASVGARGGGVGAGLAGGTPPGAGPAGAGPAGAGPAGAGPVGVGPVGVGPAGPASVGPLPAGSAGTGAGPGAPTPFGGSAGGASTTGSAGRGGVAPLGRGALPPGTGGRGPRSLPGVDARTTTTPRGWAPGPGTSGLRSVPGPSSPTWRDLVNGQRGPTGGPAEPTTGSRPGGGPGTAPRPGLPTADAGRAGTVTGGTHGVYPPMGGAGGGQGEGRRRASFLVDDSGAFEVDVPYTDPVIGEPDPPPDSRDR